MLTNAGGLGILCADACEAAGLELPQLAEETRAGLAAALPAEASVANPVDMLGSATADRTRPALPLVLADPGVDAVDRPLRPAASRATPRTSPPRSPRRLPSGAEKPVLAVVLSGRRHAGARRAAFAYPGVGGARARPRRRARRVAAPAGRHRARRRRASTDAAGAEVVEGALARADDVWLEPGEAAPLLGAYGIPVVRGAVGVEPPRRRPPRPPSSASRSSSRRRRPARTRRRAAASRSTSPTTRRCAPPRRASAARCSCSRWSRRASSCSPALVQDPVFGPLVAFGPGGVLAELIGDARFRLAPLTDVDADELVQGGKAGRLVARLPRRPAADAAALADLLAPARAASARTCPSSPSSTSTRSSASRTAAWRSTRASASAALRPRRPRRPGEPEPSNTGLLGAVGPATVGSPHAAPRRPGSRGARGPAPFRASTRKGEIVSGNETTETGWPASAPPEPMIDLAPGRAVLERVLVGVDSTPESLEAARQANRLREPDGSLEVVTALELAVSAQAGWAATGVTAQLEADAQTALEAAKEVLPEATFKIVEGGADQVLVAEAESTDATLVAVGSHEISRAVGIALGSVATTLLHSAPCSVLVARRRPSQEDFPRAIVVGVDGSPESELAAAVAFRLGERFGVEAWPIAARGGKDFDVAAVNGIASNVLVEDASPVDALVAGAGRADLLVVGSRGLHGVRALGSVSERVAHQAPCSVLVVRRPAAA